MHFKDFERVLVVYAHPDDAEYLFGGAVALLSRRGAEVNFVCCTDGCKSGMPDPSLSDDEVAAVRATEQRAAADVLGVKEVTFLGYRNGSLEVTPELRRDIVRQIRRHRPQLILTLVPFRDFDQPIGISRQEHMAVGEATLFAASPEAGTHRMYPELADEGLEPHWVDEIWIPVVTGANRYVDATEVIETKIAAFTCHVSQNGARPGRPAWTFDHPTWEPMAKVMSAAGEMIGCDYAESYRSIKR